MNTSTNIILKLIDGSKKLAEDVTLTFVDVRDVARSHLAVYENESEGRHLCISCCASYIEICDRLRIMFPLLAHQVPANVKGYSNGDRPPKVETFFSNQKLSELQVRFKPLDTMLIDTVNSLIDKQFLKLGTVSSL